MADSSSSDGYIVAFSFSIVTNLVGNILVCLIILLFRDMRIPMNYLLVNLAISDMMVAVFMAPLYVFNRTNHPSGSLGNYLCKMVTGDALAWTGALASIFTLICVSVERYLAVTYPHSKKKRLTSKKLKYIIPAGWVFAIGVNIPLFLSFTYDDNSESCVYSWPTENFMKYHSVINFHIYFLFPVVIMGTLYFRLINKLWIKNPSTSTVMQLAALKNRRRSTKMVIMVSVVYCICWFPNGFAYVYVAYSSKPLFSDVHIVSVLMVSLNSAINPIIYSLQSHLFRRHIVALFAKIISPCHKARVSPAVVYARYKETNTASMATEPVTLV